MYRKLTSSGKGWPVREAILDVFVFLMRVIESFVFVCFNVRREALWSSVGETVMRRGAELLALRKVAHGWRGTLSLIGSSLASLLATAGPPAPP